MEMSMSRNIKKLAEAIIASLTLTDNGEKQSLPFVLGKQKAAPNSLLYGKLYADDNDPDAPAFTLYVYANGEEVGKLFRPWPCSVSNLTNAIVDVQRSIDMTWQPEMPAVEKMYLAANVEKLAGALISSIDQTGKSGYFVLAISTVNALAEVNVSIEETHNDDGPVYALYATDDVQPEGNGEIVYTADRSEAALVTALTELVQALPITEKEKDVSVYLDMPIYALAQKLVESLGKGEPTENGDRSSDYFTMAKSVADATKQVMVSIVENKAGLVPAGQYYSIHVVNDVTEENCKIVDTDKLSIGSLVETLMFIISDMKVKERPVGEVFLSMSLDELATRLIGCLGESRADNGDRKSAAYILATSVEDRAKSAIVSIVERKQADKPFYEVLIDDNMSGAKRKTLNTEAMTRAALYETLLFIVSGYTVVEWAPKEEKPNGDPYKVEQLKKMLEAENGAAGGCGVHLSHWVGTSKDINIGKKGLMALIKLYETETEDDN